jgi:hypothetical protein
MVPEPRSWFKFPSATQFFDAHIPPSLASTEFANIAAPEWEYAVPTDTTHMREGEY